MAIDSDVARVEVPVITTRQPDFSEACGKFRLGLDAMKSAFLNFGDKLLANRIVVGDVKVPSTVDYHPDGVSTKSDFEKAEYSDTEVLLHTRYVVNERNLYMNQGLQRFYITPRGEIEVVTYQIGESHNRNDFKWSFAVKATPEMLSTALQGLADQHQALMKFRADHSVVGVVVPNVSK